MATLSELLQDPIFTGATKDEQKQMIDVVARQQMEKNFEPTRTPNPILDKIGQDTTMKGMQAVSDHPRIAGGLLGAGVGALQGAPGGPVSSGINALISGGLGAAFPPQNPGDIAGMGLGAVLGNKLGPLVNAAKSPAGKTAMSGLLGFLSQQMTGVAGDRTNELANKVLGTQIPLSSTHGLTDPSQLASVAPNGTQMSAGISTILPMLTQMLSNHVTSHPQVTSNNFVNEQMAGNPGKPGAPGEPVSLSQMNDLAGMQPQNTPGLAQAQQAGASTSPASVQPIEANIAQTVQQKAANLARQAAIKEQQSFLDQKRAGQDLRTSRLANETRNIKADLASKKANIQSAIDQLRLQGAEENAPQLIQARAELQRLSDTTPSGIRSQAEQNVTQQLLAEQERKAALIQQQSERNAATADTTGELNQTAGQTANAKISAGATKVQQAKLDSETTQLKNQQSRLDEGLTSLQKDADEAWKAMDPNLRSLAQESYTPDNLIKNLVKADPSTVRAYRGHLEALPNGADHIEALQNAMTQEFFKQAYDPVTKTLKNAPALFEDAFSEDKIRALYGDNKAVRFRNVVSGIEALNQKNSNVVNALHYIRNRAIWLLPEGLLLAKHAFQEPLSAAAMTATATGGFLTIAYPALVNTLLNSPKYADDFRRIATSGGKLGLYDFPSLAARLQNKSTAVEPPPDQSQPQPAPAPQAGPAQGLPQGQAAPAQQ